MKKNKGLRTYSPSEALNAYGGKIGFKVITSADGKVEGNFGLLYPDLGSATFEAESAIHDDLPSGSRYRDVLGSFISCTVTSGTVLAYYE